MTDQLGTGVPYRTITEAQLAAALCTGETACDYCAERARLTFAALPERDEARAFARWFLEQPIERRQAFLRENDLLLPDTGLDVERLTVALAAAMDPTAYEHRNDEGYGGHTWPKEWRKAMSWARQFTEGQAAEYARLTEEK